MTPAVATSPAAIYNGSGFVSGFALSSGTASTSSELATTVTAIDATTTVTEPSTHACPTASGAHNNTTCPSPEASIGKSDMTKVGVGVGVGIGVPLLAALAAVLFLWAREKKRNREYQQAAAAPPRVPWVSKPPMGYGLDNGVQEVPGQTGDYGAAQMMGGDGRKELPTVPTSRNR